MSRGDDDLVHTASHSSAVLSSTGVSKGTTVLADGCASSTHSIQNPHGAMLAHGGYSARSGTEIGRSEKRHSNSS